MSDFSAPGELYLNRELSWLEFNHRVLGEADRDETPLLERLKFLAISGSNLDEFFMVRVGGLMMQADGNPNMTGIAGLSPGQQLKKIRKRVLRMVEDQYRCLNDRLIPALEQQGIRRLRIDDLSELQLEHLKRQFDETLLAAVSPIAVRDSHDFPSMIGSALGVCFRILGPNLESIVEENLDGTRRSGDTPWQDYERIVVLPIGRFLARIMSVPVEQGMGFVLVEDVLIRFASEFLPGQTILEAVPFRTSRNADVALDIEGAADLLVGMQAMLERRNTSDCVRLEVDLAASAGIIAFLQSCVEIGEAETYQIPGPLDLSAFLDMTRIQGYRELKFETWAPQEISGYVTGDNIFELIAAEDRIIISPYQRFDPVVDFIKSAASDPKVIAIKQTLYRTSSDSEIVSALRTAAESGKHVTVILELKARFDEKRNIDWARKLERAGADVIYGVRGLKTHAKLCIVVRREATGVRRYIHFGTGNYNESTARLYSDISLLTCDEALGVDAVNLFNAITGLSAPQTMDKLAAAPLQLRERLYELIDVEIVSAKKGRKGVIRAKMNSLFDEGIIDRLYAASQAGVKIELNVRGICCLKPGVPGLSENIRVVSIVDRFLEHTRIFYFLHGGDHLVFIASADWMGRNLDRRVELLVPVLDPNCAKRVLEMLNACLADNVRSHRLLPDGSWTPLTPGNAVPLRSQLHMFTLACEESTRDARHSHKMFHPHRASGAG
jgi:polyphosphate kinase